MVSVTLTEVDIAFNEGHTILIPCKAHSEMTVDLMIPKGDVATGLDLIANLYYALEYLND
jgi:hypothetical protein